MLFLNFVSKTNVMFLHPGYCYITEMQQAFYNLVYVVSNISQRLEKKPVFKVLITGLCISLCREVSRQSGFTPKRRQAKNYKICKYISLSILIPFYLIQRVSINNFRSMHVCKKQYNKTNLSEVPKICGAGNLYASIYLIL